MQPPQHEHSTSTVEGSFSGNFLSAELLLTLECTCNLSFGVLDTINT